MKDCSNCKHLCRAGYEDYYYVCEFFGEDIPDWADNWNDGCLLKSQEIDKAMKLRDNTLVVGTSSELDEFGCPKWTKEDTERQKKEIKKYNDYLAELRKRCEKRKESQILNAYIKAEPKE